MCQPKRWVLLSSKDLALNSLRKSRPEKLICGTVSCQRKEALHAICQGLVERPFVANISKPPLVEAAAAPYASCEA